MQAEIKLRIVATVGKNNGVNIVWIFSRDVLDLDFAR